MNRIIWTRGPAIGRGSSATVSVATSSVSGDVFAVKSADIARSGVLQREQSILSSLDCPHIISYLGCQLTPLHYNLFIELAANGSLADHGGRLGEDDIRSYAGDVLSGLAHLHSRRIVHCDVKGANVLIGSDGRAKLADFGCAKRLDEEEMPLRVSGTPMFMAPEVARGEEQGAAADVWAVGCTVIEMATGGPVWPGLAGESDPVAALHRIGFSSAVPELPSWISDEGKDFLKKCLVRDPDERWTAEQLLKHPFVAAALENCVKFDQTPMWRSPKSTLDREMWESTTTEEEEVMEEHQTSDTTVAQRIFQLAGSCHSSPNWTWDGSWVAVRSPGGDDDKCSTATISKECSTTTHNEECSTATTTEEDVIEISEEEATTLSSPISTNKVRDVQSSSIRIDTEKCSTTTITEECSIAITSEDDPMEISEGEATASSSPISINRVIGVRSSSIRIDTEILPWESRDYRSDFSDFDCMSEWEYVNEKQQEFSCLRYMISFMNKTAVSENYIFAICVGFVLTVSLPLFSVFCLQRDNQQGFLHNDRRPRLSLADLFRF